MIRTLVVLMILALTTTASVAAADIRTVTLKSPEEKGADQDVDRLLVDRDLKLVQIILRNGKTMDRHKVDDPATIHCVSGSGVLIDDGGRHIALRPGVVVILAPGVQHVVKATPELSLLVTRFAEPKKPAANHSGGGGRGRRGGMKPNF